MIRALHKVRHSQSGIVLISTIILLVVGSILAASVLAMSVSESRQVQYQLDDAQAQAYARSAVRVALKVIEDRLENIETLTQAVYKVMDENSWRPYEEWVGLYEHALFEQRDAKESFEAKILASERGGVRDLSVNGLVPSEAIALSIRRENDQTALISTEIPYEGMHAESRAHIDIERKDFVFGFVRASTEPTEEIPDSPPSQKVEEGLNLLPYSFDRAVVAYDDFQMKNSVSISGTISYYGNQHSYDPSTIQWGTGKPDIIYRDSNELMAQLKNNTANVLNQGNLELRGSINSSHSGVYSKVTAQGEITVDTSAGNVVLYMNSLDVPNGATFTVSGSHKFFILLADDGSGTALNAQNGLNIVNGDNSRRPLTYIIAARDASNAGTINIGGGDSNVQAYWYAPEHDINIIHGDGAMAKYSGAMVGNNITLSRASMSYVPSQTVDLAIFEDRIIEIPAQPGEPGSGPSYIYETISIPGYSSDFMVTWLR